MAVYIWFSLINWSRPLFRSSTPLVLRRWQYPQSFRAYNWPAVLAIAVQLERASGLQSYTQSPEWLPVARAWWLGGLRVAVSAAAAAEQSRAANRTWSLAPCGAGHVCISWQGRPRTRYNFAPITNNTTQDFAVVSRRSRGWLRRLEIAAVEVRVTE